MDVFASQKHLSISSGREIYRAVCILLFGLGLTVRVLTHILEHTGFIECNIQLKAEEKAVNELSLCVLCEH